MNSQCIYLGIKEATPYCRKPKAWTCPEGKITSCPCIPADFWNVATLPGCLDKQPELPEDMSRIKDTAATKAPSPRITKPAAIRGISIFKSS